MVLGIIFPSLINVGNQHSNHMFDTGTTGFMLLATSLVMLMTPGLAFFYGGLAGKRNILGIMIQSFVSMGITTIMWFVCGYSLCFSGDALGGLIGNLDKAFMHGVNLNSPFPGNHNLPEFVFMAYQMMFAIITPALITGAFVNRDHFQGLPCLSRPLATARLLPFRAHGLGRRLACALGRARFRGRHRGACHRRFCRARFGFLRRPPPRQAIAAEQHSADRHRHRAALVRLVWLQRRERAGGQRHYRRWRF